MAHFTNGNPWASSEHARQYLRRADSIPHRLEGEASLLEFVPREAKRVLDLGSGGGRLLELLKATCPEAEFVALDFSPAMLETLRRRFGAVEQITILAHDLASRLPPMGQFDCVVSSFAIHHLHDERKRTLYQEIFSLLLPDGVFCNLEHVASPTLSLHHQFLRELGISPQEEDASNQLLDVETQLAWLRQIGFRDVDCHWKWRELALLAGIKSRVSE